jgi:hypothetical protein
MDPSITEPATQDPGVVEATQPEEQPATAETTPVTEPTSTPTEPTEQPAEEPAQSDNSADDFDYEAWLEKKGIDPASPEGKAAIAKSWREMEQKMHQTTQKASEIEKQLTSAPVDIESDNPLVQQLAEEVVNMKRVTQVREFMQENKITEAQNLAMGKWLEENPTKRDMVNAGYLSLQEAYDLSGIGRQDTTAIKDQGAKEALEGLATQQRGTAPQSSASTSKPAPAEDPILAELKSD